jgi:ABC-type molybdenum transport system ATPase subunit/photorepair protein PhrA
VAAGLAASLGLTQRIGAADRSASRLALARVGATSLADRPVTLISGGESRLVLIARALVSGARVLVLDEPMAGLDLRNRRRFCACSAALPQKGTR